jgi:nucleoside-diphosphate-sugar epimerase
MKKIIITGGLGHIGSYLIEKFLAEQENIHLVIIDNLQSQRYSSLFDLKIKKNKVSFFDLDLTKESISSVIKKADLIIHLAAITDAENSVGKEKIYMDNNVKCTEEVIKHSNKFKVPLLFPSSTSVYGKMKRDAILFEDDNSILFPQSPYAKIKLKEEKDISRKLINSKFIIIRLGTIVGKSMGMRFHTAVNKFCYQASMDKEITVWRSAYDQVRPYATLNDFYRISLFFLKNKKLINNQTYNLVSKNLTVRDIINIIKIKKNVKIKFVNSKIMNQLSYNVSNSKLLKIGFKSSNDLKKEIFKTLKIFKIDNYVNK